METNLISSLMYRLLLLKNINLDTIDNLHLSFIDIIFFYNIHVWINFSALNQGIKPDKFERIIFSIEALNEILLNSMFTANTLKLF